MSKLKDLVPGIKEDNIPKKGTNVDELEMGIKVEMEHVATFKKIEEYYMKNKEMPSEKQMAEWVTRDHLKEFNDYYTRLKKMEGSQGLKESKVGDTYIEIGETVEAIDAAFYKLVELTKIMRSNRVNRNLGMMRNTIDTLKKEFSESYDFDWEK